MKNMIFYILDLLSHNRGSIKGLKNREYCGKSFNCSIEFELENKLRVFHSKRYYCDKTYDILFLLYSVVV